ncbi:chromosome segregation protein SMC [Romboutsia lituseburensis]|uniref:Chromosome partition protein Smc n=1 Tax=Romboutsia lituseburensis DSM 797 TaxID=1121325 RepID=A0A1G9Q5G0_9FIRM|nr:chromosome segregation protein SMC [Romboutsia lituseburensis]SDM06258.1 condensin subunit Smc [Romboutsia lituseburensis DSM 797]
MYLKRLELKGFKSFPTKTDILFNEGITAIVGPNGSGKSNISDAVRWVLGEQSIKSLRGEKLEDVIFAGTDTKKAMNYCEVALTIDNSDNKLDLDFNEITIKRRAYRNGESSFFLNNKSCRLKDIKEILLDTGIGKDGYSIIEQGKVDEILSNNPANRRKVFDEACGISKFRYKKQEAEKNLRNTKENLERINDIYIEIENQLKPLFIQQEKANKYLEISEKLKIIEVNSYIREIEELERELNEINKHSQLLENQLIETEKQKELAENGFNDTNKEIDDINESISKAQDYINSINSVISKKDSQINIINERIKNHKNEIERCIKEAEEIKEKIKFNNNSLKELQDSKINNEDKINSLNKDIESLNKLNLNKKEEIDSINTELENLKDDIINILNKKQEASSKLSTLTANMDNINSRTETIDLDINEINKELNQKNEHLKECNQNFDSKNINLEKVKNRYEENIVQLKELNELSENLDKNIQDNKYKLNNYNSKLTVYVEMENHNEGFNKGVKEVLKNKSLRGIHGALGQVISVSQKYEKAIESVLGAYMQNIITDDENSAKMAINYLKQNNLGRVTFLPLSIIKSNKINLNNIKSNTNCIGVASDLLSYDEKYKNILENILGRTIVIDTIDNGIKFAKETGHKYKVVTLDGEILNPGGSLTGGSFRTNANILSRKRLINEYSEKIKIKENEIKTLLSKKEEYNQKNSSLKNNIIDLELDIKNIDKDIIIQGSKINRIEDEIKVLKQNLNKLQNEKDGLKLNQNITIERTNSVKKEIDSLENNHKTNKDRILKLTTQVKESSGTYENDKVKHDSLNLELAKYNQVYENILSEINRINNENIELELKLNNTEEVLKQQQIETSKLEENIIIEQTEKLSLNKQLGDNIRNLENKKVVKESLKQKLEDTNKDVKTINRQHMDLKESLFKVQGKLDRLKATIETYTNKLFENYEMTIEEALIIKDDLIEIDKKLLESLKREIRSLGHVNIDSIKEYEEVKERYDFYSEQKQDLEQSIEAIEKLISDLEKNMKSEFKVKFKEINENFKYVYKRLFGGGYGELTILDEQNILESDIEITAQPPGKKMKNLNLLSGGEKALTAISILFSILIAKPTPFCILDEIEAPLDDANIFRFGEFLKELSKDTQFISVTHRRGTMEASDYIYGVTMQEKAISKVLSLKLNEAEEITDVI